MMVWFVFNPAVSKGQILKMEHCGNLQPMFGVCIVLHSSQIVVWKFSDDQFRSTSPKLMTCEQTSLPSPVVRIQFIIMVVVAGKPFAWGEIPIIEEECSSREQTVIQTMAYPLIPTCWYLNVFLPISISKFDTVTFYKAKRSILLDTTSQKMRS